MKWTSNELYRVLNGLVSFYKPSNCSIEKFGKLFQVYLANGFNRLPTENRKIVTNVIRDANETTIIKVKDILSLPKVSGPNFYSSDFEMYAVNPLPAFASGVQVVGIGPVGLSLSSKMFEENSYLNVYRLTMMMGRSTQSGTPDSNTVMRTSWKNIGKYKIDYILQNRLNNYISMSYIASGLAPNSQAAYDALCDSSGLLRPKMIPADEREHTAQIRKPSAIVYGLNCIKFEPPHFTIEMHVINEDIDFIIGFMRDIGRRLKTALVLTQCRRIRHGRFTAESSLCLKDLRNLEPDTIVKHMEMSNGYHSFESLQTDQKNLFLVKDDKIKKHLLSDGFVNKNIRS